MDGGVRIWMTGAGLVTSLGTGLGPTFAALHRGERGIGHIDLFDPTGYRAQIAACVQGVSVPSVGREWSRTSAFALAASQEALAGAGVDPRAMRVGLVIGSTTGGMFETEGRLAKLHAEPHSHEGRKALQEMLSHPLTSTGDCLAAAIGPFARVRTVCSACSSGANALAIGALWLIEGSVDAVLAGGTDGLCKLTMSGFGALAAIDPDPCRPFDRRRRGLNLGEGAGFAVLERASSARTRGKAPIAELAGWAIGAEAHHITNPRADGSTAAALIRGALQRAHLSPAEIDYVNAHGTGTPLNDPMEAAGLNAALGAEARRIPVSSSKGQIGHTLGAAGAIEAVVTALCIQNGAIPPTAGLEEPDPACDLVHVMEPGRKASVRAALSNSFGFGGMDTVLVLSQPELGAPLASGSRRVVITGGASLTPAGLLGTTESASLASGPPLPVRAGRLEFDLGAALDTSKARRLDRPARLGAVVTGRALADAAADPSPKSGRSGVVFGCAFGSVDASAAFMHRVFVKGPRMASPADFPNLVPSSPVGHVSIYFGLMGPTLGTADLATSGESAIAAATELVANGEADLLVAGSIEEASDIAERILVGLFARSEAEAASPRGEGAAAVVVETEAHATARGARVLARVERAFEWHNGAAGALAGLRAPADFQRARVVLQRDTADGREVVASTPWGTVPRLEVAPRAGQHEGLGAMAVAAAVGLLARGEAREALVVGLAKGRGQAFLLSAP